MTCAEVRELFSDVADTRLASGERAAWDAHLAACPECGREWASFQRTLDLLHGLPHHRAPAGFVDRVMAAAYPESWSRRLARLLFVPLRLKLPLEAAALMLVAVGLVYLVQSTSPVQRAIRDGAPPSSSPVTAAAPRPEAVLSGSPRVAPESKALDEASQGDLARGRAARAESQRAPARTAPEDSRDAPPAPALPAGETPQARVETHAYKAPQSPSSDVRVPVAAPPTSASARSASEAPAVVGHLVVEDRDAAERALGELNARVGATEVGRAVAEDGLVVELDVPRARYAEFSRGLGHLGRWTPTAERVGPGAAVRVRVTVARSPSP